MRFFSLLAAASFVLTATAAGDRLVPVVVTHPDFPGMALTLRVEVAVSDAERRRGLSGRRTLPARGGMLFLMEPPTAACLWMKDTLFPLAAAFIDGDGVVRKTARMFPNRLVRHCADGPVPYVLETAPRWLDGVLRVGGRVRFPGLRR